MLRLSMAGRILRDHEMPGSVALASPAAQPTWPPLRRNPDKALRLRAYGHHDQREDQEDLLDRRQVRERRRQGVEEAQRSPAPAARPRWPLPGPMALR